MRRNPYYALEVMNGVPYLLPFGQNIADNKPSFMMNETGVFIWNNLENTESEKGMVDLLLHSEMISPYDLNDAVLDVHEFMSMLKNAEVILPDPIAKLPVVGMFSIAGILIELRGIESYIPKSFESFRVFGQMKPDLSVNIITGKGGVKAGEIIVLANNELNLYENDENWHLEFPKFDHIESVVISKNLNECEIKILYEQETATVREELFHVLRHVFLIKAQSFGRFAIHSSSILYRGKAFLFSAPSGTGKSTHTNLWRELFNTDFINGDLNLVSEDGIVYGIPWCGTSDIFTTKNYSLGGIIFLKQSKDDTVEELEGDDKSLKISKRLISPAYKKEMLEKNLSFSVKLSKKIPAWKLKCTKNPSAAELMKETIDHYLNRSVR